MKKKRQKSFQKRNQKNNRSQKKKHQIPPTSISSTTDKSSHLIQSGNFQPKYLLKIFKTSTIIIDTKHLTIATKENISRLDQISVDLDLTKFFSANFVNQSLDDKSKYLHKIYDKVLILFYLINVHKPSQTGPTPIEFSENSPRSKKPHLIIPKSFSLPHLETKCIHNDAQYTQSCENIFLNSLHEGDYDRSEWQVENKLESKSRPSYIIERDCHVFGGCVDEEADDEFFISSGAVYQSWPYLHEPGFRLTNLPQLPIKNRSLSDEQINYTIEHENEALNNIKPYELPSYSLDNYGINLFHTQDSREKQKSKKSRRRCKKAFNSTFSTVSSYVDSDLSSESSDDDSDSYRAYKHRHAIGLTNFNAYNSQSSLSDLGHKSHIRDQYLRTNLCYTDSSSCDEHLRKSSDKNAYVRLTTSYNTNEDGYAFGDFGRQKNYLLGRAKCMSYTNKQCLSSNYYIF